MNDQVSIENAIADFVAAYNRGDVAAVMACYSDDLVKLRHGAPQETKAETTRRLAQTLRKYVGHLAVQNDEILVSGDIAFIRGVLMIVLSPRGAGQKQSFERRFVELWRRVDGRWRVARTMDNLGP